MWKYIAGTAGVGLSAITISNLLNARRQKMLDDKAKEQCQTAWKSLHQQYPTKYSPNMIMCQIKDRKLSEMDKLWGEVDTHINHQKAVQFNHFIKTKSAELTKDKTDKVDLVIFLETYGGELGAVKMITDTMKTFKKKHNGGCFVVVNDHALSGGTIISLAADEVMMDDFACLSKIDPQMMGIPVRHLEHMKDEENCGPIAGIVSNMSHEAMGSVRDLAEQHFKPHYDDSTFNNILNKLVYSNMIHGHSFTKEECQTMGIRAIDIPEGLTLTVDFSKDAKADLTDSTVSTDNTSTMEVLADAPVSLELDEPTAAKIVETMVFNSQSEKDEVINKIDEMAKSDDENDVGVFEVILGLELNENMRQKLKDCPVSSDESIPLITPELNE